MPMALVMAELQRALEPDRLRQLLDGEPDILERLAQNDGLIGALERVMSLPPAQRAYFERIPPALREGVRATVLQALSDGKAVQVQYSPGYDFEIRLWDYGGAVSIHVSGPYGSRPENEFAEA